MFLRRRHPGQPLLDRGPLRVMFVHTEVVVGGAETLLAEIIRHMDRERFTPELCCLKRLAELGEVLARELPTHVGLLAHKYDVRVWGRLTRLLRKRRIDAVVTVGTGGDRMFWGRLAAWRARVPVILSALHSTGYPQKVERINRLLAGITDGFIGCARSHSQYLVAHEGCPADKVFTIYNGVDVERFRPGDRESARRQLGLPADAPVCGIVAALRPEKQHLLLLEAFRQVVNLLPTAILVVVGDGHERPAIERQISELYLRDNVRLLGTRHDVAALLPAFDVKVLSSRMEANPASTLEAAACGVAVVAPRVGSLAETVEEHRTGLLYEPNCPDALALALLEALEDPRRCRDWGAAGRRLVEKRFSLDVMVRGYENLIEGVYQAAVLGRRFLPAELDSQTESGKSQPCVAGCEPG